MVYPCDRLIQVLVLGIPSLVVHVVWTRHEVSRPSGGPVIEPIRRGVTLPFSAYQLSVQAGIGGVDGGGVPMSHVNYKKW